ncbi:MAG: tetratricopeptide repeat protein [Phycisphaerales bacterium]
MNDWSEAESHVERAHELYEAGRWDEAEQALRRALSLNPYRAEWHFNLGLTLEAAGRWEQAVEALVSAYDLNQQDEQAPLLLGVICLRLERPEDALRWLKIAEGAASRPSTKAEVAVHQIEALAALDRHDEAEEAFYFALHCETDDSEDESSTDPGARIHAQAYANMAEAMMSRQEWDRAIYCFREAANLDATIPRVHARLAAALSETGRHERARQLYLRELRDNPGDIDTLLDLGCLLVDMNRLMEAHEKFRRVLELESNNTDAHFYLGDLALRQHRRRDAEAAFRLVMRLDQAYPEVRRRLAELAIDRGEHSEARRLLRQEGRDLLEQPKSFSAEDLDDLGQLLLDAKLPRDACRVFERLVEHAPEDAKSWHHLSVAGFQMGDRAAGMAAARKALRLDPKQVAVLHNMALASIQERRWKRAKSYIAQLREVDPDDGALRRLSLSVRLGRVIELLGVLAGRIRPAGPDPFEAARSEAAERSALARRGREQQTSSKSE